MPRLSFLLVLLLVASLAGAQNLPPGMTMHRAQAGGLDASGWTRAASTKGNYSVRVPCLFNDFTVEDLDPSSKAKQLDTVGCLRDDRKKFSVTRFQYKHPEADAMAFFEKGKKDFRRPGQQIISSTIRGAPAFDVAVADSSRCGFIRMIHIFPENYLLVAEVASPSCSGLEALSRVFMESLVVGGK